MGRERIDTAFAFDALQLEIVFISGPLLAAGIATLLSPAVAVLTAAAMQTAGRARRGRRRPSSRRWQPAQREPGDLEGGRPRRARACALWCAALMITAVSLGVLEICIPAFAEQLRSRSDSGWLFALWALGSLIGGLWYGARRWRSGTLRRFFFVSVDPRAGARAAPARGVAAGLLGAARSSRASASPPRRRSVTRSSESSAPEGAVTEAYAWQIVAYVGGSLGRRVARGRDRSMPLGVATALACSSAAAGRGLLVAKGGGRCGLRGYRLRVAREPSTTLPTLRRSAMIRCASRRPSNGKASATTG